MRAALLHTHGAAPALGDHPSPTAGDGQSLVDVVAAPITPLDLLCAGGSSYFGPPATPYVPGVQGVGVVRESSTLAPGTTVWFATTAGMSAGDGSLAEHCVVADDDLVEVPDGVDPAAVAALGLSAVAAWVAVSQVGRLAPGEQLLVLGGGGVVGQVAIQAGRVLGARRVLAAARSASAQARARAAGADAVIALPSGGDPRDQEEVAALARAFEDSANGPIDVVLDPLCGLPATAAATLLAPGGRLVNLGSSAGPDAVWDSAVLRSRSAAILGYTNNNLTADQRRDALLAVLDHAAQGRIAVSHEQHPLADVDQAWERQRAGAAGGRVVLTI